jgi:glyoxylase-like metal-dependent hydrolase (beta-lactamase superfamily II)
MAASDFWQELGDGTFRRRYEFLDQNIGLVVGGEAVLLIDTRSHPGHAEEVLSDLRRVTQLPVGWVFNTHYHWDHAFGNQVFGGSAIWGHVNCRTELLERGLSRLDELLIDYPDEADGFGNVVVTPPTEVFDDRATIDLGNRTVEMSHYGYGHTNSDAALHTDEVTFAGDLVEEGAPPSFGDSFPIAWFDTVGRLAAEARATVVPGHGDVVDVEYLVVSRFDLGWIARQARQAIAAGLAADHVDLKGSPYPEDHAREALHRAYLELRSSTG